MREALERARSPILSCSFGKDSMLLLHLARQIRPEIPVLIFNALWDKGHKKWVEKVITDLNLVAFFCRPNVLQYQNGSVLSFYPFGSHQIPLITDVLPGEACGLDLGNKVLSGAPLAVYPWDLTLVGSRKTDSHRLVPDLEIPPSTETHRIAAPLWELSDADVWALIDELGVGTDPRVYVDEREEFDPGNLKACFSCLEPDRTVYCPKLGRNIQSIR
jgi:hypothetical protein